MCSVEKVFLEILQNSQENTCARDSQRAIWPLKRNLVTRSNHIVEN